MTDHKPALAALVAQVLDRRYPKQPFEGSEKEDWLRSAMEGDPVVLLEAAWEWREEHAQGHFRPTPGQLKREVADKWCPDSKPFISLERAVQRVKDDYMIPGLDMLIDRMGRGYFEEALEGPVRESHRKLWAEACHKHRVWAFAKKRMEYRGMPPWNPSEGRGIALPEGANFREALGTPAKRADQAGLSIGASLAATKRIAKDSQ